MQPSSLLPDEQSEWTYSMRVTVDQLSSGESDEEPTRRQRMVVGVRVVMASIRRSTTIAAMTAVMRWMLSTMTS